MNSSKQEQKTDFFGKMSTFNFPKKIDGLKAL